LSVCADNLDLSHNNLTGTIPSEVINSLTNLGEFLGSRLPSFFSFLCAPHGYAFSWIALCIADALFLYDNMLTGNYTCPGFITYCGISCDDDTDLACRSRG
jgi:hypothetical protein